jgi:carboxypeptidase D
MAGMCVEAQDTPKPSASVLIIILDFRVKDPLPNVTEPIARNFAGNIAVDREGHPNNTLWFRAFERENGSLTSAPGEREDEPWLIWVNGGKVSNYQ